MSPKLSSCSNREPLALTPVPTVVQAEIQDLSSLAMQCHVRTEESLGRISLVVWGPKLYETCNQEVV